MRAFPLLAVALFGLGCAQLDAVDLGRCGNAVVEPGEDCDPGPSGTSHPGACGAVGTAYQCLFQCAADDECAPSKGVPAGYRCDVGAGYCVTANGRVNATQTSLVGPVKELIVGDFSGDGVPDLATVGALQTSFLTFAATGDVASKLTLPLALRGSAFGVFSSSNIDGLAAPMNVGEAFGTRLELFLPQADGTLAPTIYPNGTLPAGVTLRVAGAAHAAIDDRLREPVVILDSAGVGSLPPGVIVAHVDFTKHPILPSPIAKLDATALGTISGFGLFNFTGLNDCGELVIARPGSKTLDMVSLCDTQSHWLAPSVKVTNITPIPVQGTIDAHAVVLVTRLHPGIKSEAEGALVGPINGKMFFLSFDAMTKAPVLVPAEPLFAPANPFSQGSPDGKVRAPLAVGNLDDLGLFDVVTPYGAFACDDAGNCSSVAAPGANALPWTEAAVADFNANGRADVVAGSSCAVGLDFFNGTGGLASFSLSVLPTDSPVARFSVGDFDGDLIPDLVLAELGEMKQLKCDDDSVFPGGDDLPVVLYGRPWEPLEAPVVLGSVPSVTQTVAAPLVRGSLISDLAIVNEAAGPDGVMSDQFAFLPGNTNRLLTSPYQLTWEPGQPQERVGDVFTIAAGRFLAADTTRSHVAAIARRQLKKGDNSGPTFDLWLVKVTDEADIVDANPMQQALDGFRTPANVEMLTAALVPGGPDNVVLVGPDAQEPMMKTRVAVGVELNGAFDLNVMTLDAPLNPHAKGQLALQDFDGDGIPDLAIVSNLDMSNNVKVFWGDGKGSFTSSPAVFAAPKNEGVPLRITALSAIHTSRTAHVEPLFTATQFAFVAHLGAGRKYGEVTFQDVVPDLTIFPNDVLTARDFNGDGIDDIAIGGDNGVTLYVGEARPPGP